MQDNRSIRLREWLGYLPFVVFAVAYILARGLLEASGLANWLMVSIALTPIPAFAWVLVTIIRGIRSLDELQRRVHLEALAFAFPLTLLLLMTLGLLDLAVELSPEDWGYRHIWPYAYLFYLAGLTISWRRYK
jgi:hypothetical protein